MSTRRRNRESRFVEGEYLDKLVRFEPQMLSVRETIVDGQKSKLRFREGQKSRLRFQERIEIVSEKISATMR